MEEEGTNRNLAELGEELGKELSDLAANFRAACEALGGEVSGGVSLIQGVDFATDDVQIGANFTGSCKVPSSKVGLP